jgi:hypothetical protein
MNTNRKFWGIFGVLSLAMLAVGLYNGSETKRRPTSKADVAFLSVPKHHAKHVSAEPIKPSKEIVELSPVYITVHRPVRPAPKKKNCYVKDLVHSHSHVDNQATVMDNGGKVKICETK